MADPVSYDDYRAAARRRLPNVLFQYVDGGSMSEATLARNLAAFRSLALRQRAMRDVARVETGIELFGESLAAPVILAPLGIAGLLRRRGEVQAARAAAAGGLPFCVSNFSICPYDEVRAGVERPPWIQILVAGERALTEALLDRVEASGARVLILTVDVPVPAVRYRDMRAGLVTPRGPIAGATRILDGLAHPAWLLDVYLGGRPHSFGNVRQAEQDFAGRSGRRVPYAATPTLHWDHLAWLRDRWRGPLIVKGMLDPEDAARAAAAGVDGVIVSNHGGRQLDSARGALAALPDVVSAVGGRAAVLMDGGVRTGADVLKALALGAKACLIGRAWAFALAARGEVGVKTMLGRLRAEVQSSMAMAGCTSIAEIGPDLAVRP